MGSARRCVIGLAASWIAARDKQLPPADAATLRGMLAIAAEREFASDAGDLVFDYCSSDAPHGAVALLAAAPRSVVDPLLSMARTAGLSVAAVTSSTVALAASTRGVVLGGGRLVLCVLPTGVELALHTFGGPRLLRHLPLRLTDEGASDRLAAELGRLLALAPPPGNTQAPRELLAWDALGIDRSLCESIARQFGATLRLAKLPDDIELLGAMPPQHTRFAQAAALSAGSLGEGAFDFLHSRLAPPPVSRFGRRAVWGAVAGAAVLLAVLAMLGDYTLHRHRVSALEDQLSQINPAAQAAKKQVDDCTFVQGWYDHRPEILKCMAQVAAAFPPEGRSWATYMRTRDDLQIELSIKAINEDAVLEILDRLESNPNLANVTPMFLRQAGDKSGQWAVEVTLGLREGR